MEGFHQVISLILHGIIFTIYIGQMLMHFLVKKEFNRMGLRIPDCQNKFLELV